MNILYCHRTQGRGAEGLHIVSISEALKRHGHHVVMLSPPGIDPLVSAGNLPVDKDVRKQQGIGKIWQLISTKFPQSLFELAELLFNIYWIPVLGARLLRGKTHMIYERYSFFTFATAFLAGLTKTPYFLEANEVCGIERARKQSNMFLMDFIERYVMSKAQAIFTVSSFLKKKMLEKGVEETKIIVMPNAIAPNKFDFLSNRDKIRNKYGLDHKIVIGFAGWFDTWDQLDKLIMVFGHVKNTVPSHLLLIGSGNMMNELKQIIKSESLSDHVTLTGPIPRMDVLHYIDALDIAVLPHSNEFGSPMVLFEFMALGKAVIAPKLDPICDVIDPGVNGLTFTKGCFSELEACLVKLMKSKELREKLGAEAQKKVNEQYTWDKHAMRILEQFGRLD